MTRKRLGSFDSGAFYAALNATRLARELTWKQVAGESGVSASTLTRMAQGRRPDVDGLAALATWSGLSTDRFVRPAGNTSDAEPIALISTYLRSDKNLSPRAAAALSEVVKVSYEQFRDLD